MKKEIAALKQQPDDDVVAFASLVLDYIGPPSKDAAIEQLLDSDRELRRRARALVKASRHSHEDRFRVALERIAAYMTPAQLRRESGRSYGLESEEALEMAYENVLGEAKFALRVLRRKKRSSVDLSKSTDSSSEG
jgi:hypothetical protein